MKEHEISKLVNELTEIAMKYGGMKQLRQRISDAVVSAVKRSELKELHGELKEIAEITTKLESLDV